MRALRFLLHAFSYLFHFVLAVFLLGIAVVARGSHSASFDLPMIPWVSGAGQVPFLLIAAPIGIAVVLLAVRGRARALFTIYALFVWITALWGFFLGPYNFGGWDGFHTAVCFTLGATVAAIGAISQLKPLR